jgi:SsrA-binding protein
MGPKTFWHHTTHPQSGKRTPKDFSSKTLILWPLCGRGNNMSIAENRRARFNYHITEQYEVGMVLQGWEIKAIREGQVQLTDGYVVIKQGELFLIGCRINPLRSASTHVKPEADRTRKLLMHKDEIKRLIGKVEQKGFTLVPLNLHYKGGYVKADIALAKGKAEHDKRETQKERDWNREKGRLMRH